MNQLELYATLCPPDADFDAIAKVNLRAVLFDDPVASVERAVGYEDPERPVASVRSNCNRARGRHWQILVAAAAAAVLVGGLVVIAGRDSSTRSDDGRIGNITSAPSTEQSETTDASSRRPVDDPSLPPGFVLPPQLATIDPAVLEGAPSRGHPTSIWLSEPMVPKSRWFVRRDAAGNPTGGIRADDIVSDTKWSVSFADGDAAGIVGVDGRFARRSRVPTIGWETDGSVRAVAAIGDVPTTELVAFAADAVAVASIDEIVLPAGFEEFAIPDEIGTVAYSRPYVTVGLSVADDDSSVDLATLAYMTPERSGDVTPMAGGDGYIISLVNGYQVVFVGIDDGSIATLTATKSVDPETLAQHVRLTPTMNVPVRQGIDNIPADAEWHFGETSKGRWAFVEYIDDDGLSCKYIAAADGAIVGCAPVSQQGCPAGSVFDGVNAAPEYSIVLPYPADSVTVRFDGQQAASTIEQSSGFTFVYGPAPQKYDRLEVLVDGEIVCPTE